MPATAEVTPSIMQPLQDGTPGLEDKIRGLILSNSAGDSGAPAPATNESSGLAPPPGLGSASGPQKSPKPARKRLNQAQRRQMSAQLSIPIDTRPQMPPSGSQYSSPLAPGSSFHHPHRHQHSHPSHQGHHSNGHPRPHSAAFHPSYQQLDGQPPNSPERAGSFSQRAFPAHPPPGPFHHQTRSFHEHMFSAEHAPGWRPQQHDGRGGALPPFSFGGLPPGPGQGPAPSPGAPRRPTSRVLKHHERQPPMAPEDIQAQAVLLEELCRHVIDGAEISYDEIVRNEAFRVRIESICRAAIAQHEMTHNMNPTFPPASVQLRCFGSLSSGFATKASDMDLGLLSPLSAPLPEDPNSPIPRLIEKAFLDAGLGARLLSRTRVPIIKLCERPPEKLRRDLLEERAKWERGEEDEPDALCGDEEEEAPQSPTIPATTSTALSKDGDSTGVPVVGSDAYKRKVASLKQESNSDLNTYFKAARRLLRRLGGSDIPQHGTKALDSRQVTVVTDVALAFMRGLADGDLRRRLEMTEPVSVNKAAVHPRVRSLRAVFRQAEGERLVMAWEKRLVHEKEPRLEKEGELKCKVWASLLNQASFGVDPSGCAKELQVAAEAIRRLPSVQLHTLKQAQHESAVDYHSRTVRLMLDLGLYDNAPSPGDARRAVVRHYVLGICNATIRTQVMGLVTTTCDDSLRATARRHKSLQLALEFENALAKGFYAEQRAHVEEYLAVLRRPMQPSVPAHRHYDFVVPVSPADLELLRRIKTLPDPGKTAPNQPRDPYRDRLGFPKTEVGVQCDINFSAHLALQNTLLLRCYSHTDPRVRPLVLFVKHWAKVRNINSPYHGTLSSYGYVLMMLHFLVNVAHPFVCPNLQELAPPITDADLVRLTPEEIEAKVECRGRNVRFWRDEDEIKRLAAEHSLNQNGDSIGYLLRCFFEYYAQTGQMSTLPCRGFDWGRDVLSLRTPGGLLTKAEKGWTSAKTVHEVQRQQGADQQQQPQQQPQLSPRPNSAPTAAASMMPQQPCPQPQQHHHAAEIVKEVRHRYLFATEDPFELEHNVARTVTHNGIVAIRDEFRRAWRIIKGAGKAPPEDLQLLTEAATEKEPTKSSGLADLMAEIHGRELPF